MKQLKTCMNYEVTKGKEYTEPSLTKPDMSMSIQEIILRFSQGQSIALAPNAIYTGDYDLPEPSRLDYADREALYEYNQKRMRKLLEEIQHKRSLRKQAKMQQQIDILRAAGYKVDDIANSSSVKGGSVADANKED